MCTVVVAEDHEIFREGLQRILGSNGISVVGEASNGQEVASLVASMKPDVLVLDLDLPGLHGLGVLRNIVGQGSTTKVLILSAETREQVVVGALKDGAAGYILKTAPAVELVKAITVVAGGSVFVSPELAGSIMTAIGHGLLNETPDPYDRVTPREREIFQLMAEGFSNGEIGERLSISARTVETHRAKIRRRLSLKSQTDVVRFALRRGLVNFDRY